MNKIDVPLVPHGTCWLEKDPALQKLSRVVGWSVVEDDDDPTANTSPDMAVEWAVSMPYRKWTPKGEMWVYGYARVPIGEVDRVNMTHASLCDLVGYLEDNYTTPEKWEDDLREDKSLQRAARRFVNTVAERFQPARFQPILRLRVDMTKWEDYRTRVAS